MYDQSILYMEHGWLNPDYDKFSYWYFITGAGKPSNSVTIMAETMQEIKTLLRTIDTFLATVSETELCSKEPIPNYPDQSLKRAITYEKYYEKLGQCRYHLTKAYGEIYNARIRLKRNEYKSQNQKALNHGGIYTDNHDCLRRRQHRNRSFHLHGVRL